MKLKKQTNRLYEEEEEKYIYLQIRNLFCEKHLYLGHDKRHNDKISIIK